MMMRTTTTAAAAVRDEIACMQSHFEVNVIEAYLMETVMMLLI